MQLVDGIDEKILATVDVGSIGNAHVEDVELVAVILRHVLIVLREELAVGEGDDRSVDGFDERRRVVDGADASACAVADDVVAHLDSSCHERDAVVDVLEDVLHGETDTSRQTTRDNHQPCVVDTHDA